MSESFKKMFSPRAKNLLKAALEEDIGTGDVTSDILVPQDAYGKAVIIAKDTGILCGTPVLEELFHQLDPEIKIKSSVKEGRSIIKNRPVLRLEGHVRSILAGERTALNFLGHLSAIATKTRHFVDRVKQDSVLVLDTRKTTPLLREFEKYAVRIGGGKNHRMGLYAAIFVKENHRPYGDLSKLKKYANQFEVEVRNLKELREVMKYSPRVILFDNFKPDALRHAVRIARAKHPEIILEASGGIKLDTVVHYASMGVDWISIGSLTHSVQSLDFSLLIS